MANKKLSPLRGYWVCRIKGKGWVSYDSISYTKKTSISRFIEHSTLTWEQWQEKGWECIKVNVSFELFVKKVAK